MAQHVTLYSKRFFGTLAIVLALGYPGFGGAIVPYESDKTEKKDKTMIVTGATGKMGACLTHHLARRKARVIMACRDMEKCKQIRRQIVASTGHHGIVCRHLDLEDLDSINTFADDMIKNEPHIDVLINNAAVKQLKDKELTKYGIEKHFWINFLAPFILTFKLMPKLKETASQTLETRVINVVGKPTKKWDIALDDINFDKRKYSGRDAYNQSKLALAYFTILLDEHCWKERNRVYVYATNPVYRMMAEPIVLDHPLTWWEKIKRMFIFVYTIESDKACQPAIHCAVRKDVLKRSETGKLYDYFLHHWSWKGADKPEDREFAKHVWNTASGIIALAPKYLEMRQAEEQESKRKQEEKDTKRAPDSKSQAEPETVKANQKS